MTITPLDIYLISLADDISRALYVILACAGGLFVANAVLADCTVKEVEKKSAIKRVKNCGAVFLTTLVFCTFIPSSKTIASMYILPAVVNNTHIQNSAGNALELLERLTKDWLKDTIKEQDIKQGEANI